MKKTMRLLSITLLSVLLLFVGCSTSKTIKDGTYKAEFAKADEHEWIEYVEITVANEKITEVVFDGKKIGENKEVILKSRDPDYKAAMEGAGYKTWPSDFYPKLAEQLVAKQNIDDVDAVAGATNSYDAFKKLVKSLEKNMSSGKTDVVKVAE